MKNCDKLHQVQNNSSFSDLPKAKLEEYYRACLLSQMMWRFIQVLSTTVAMSVFAKQILECKANVGKSCLIGVSGVVSYVARHKNKQCELKAMTCQKELEK
jgi:hypothetical protein